MTKSERYKQEMLVRARDFGAAHPELFPESSPGGDMFARVAAAVAAVEEHLKSLAMGGASTRGVKATTREAVHRYMKTLAKAARRIARPERDPGPFKLPRRNLLHLQVAAAQAFLVEAERRQPQFIAMGLPPTFISDYRALVDELTQASYGRLNSKTIRAKAHAGITSAIQQGLEIVRDLDVLVDIATTQDPVLASAWRAARRIEGQKASTPARQTTATPEAETSSAVDRPAADLPVAPGAASAPATPEPTADTAVTALAPDVEALRRVS